MRLDDLVYLVTGVVANELTTSIFLHQRDHTKSSQQLFVALVLQQQQSTTGVQVFWERAEEGAEINALGIDDDGPISD